MWVRMAPGAMALTRILDDATSCAMLMRSMAQEVASSRIRVNAIAPGAIRTHINREAWSTPQAEHDLLDLIPYGRIGEVDDVARAAVWLASDDSDYVTG